MITFRELIKVLDPDVVLEVCGAAVNETNDLVDWFCIYHDQKAGSIKLTDNMWFPDEPILSITKIGDAISIFIVSNRE